MRAITLGIAALVSTASIAGCGSDNVAPGETIQNYSGNYAGKVRFFDPENPGQFIDSTSVTATIVNPSGSRDLTGSWATPYSSGGLLGTIEDGWGTMTVTLQQTNPCQGEFDGHAGKSSRDGEFIGISGQYEGDDCNGHVHADFQLLIVE